MIRIEEVKLFILKEKYKTVKQIDRTGIG